MAMGASGGRVLGMVLGQGLRLVVVGVIIGMAASAMLTRLLQTQLFNVRPTDPATIGGVILHPRRRASGVLHPASRATRVDPMVVLRDE